MCDMHMKETFKSYSGTEGDMSRRNDLRLLPHAVCFCNMSQTMCDW